MDILDISMVSEFDSVNANTKSKSKSKSKRLNITNSKTQKNIHRKNQRRNKELYKINMMYDNSTYCSVCNKNEKCENHNNEEKIQKS